MKELEKHKRMVKLSYSPTEEIPEGCIPLEEGIEEFWMQLENNFGYDIRIVED